MSLAHTRVQTTQVLEHPRLGVSTAILAAEQRRERHAHDAIGSTGRGGDAEFVGSLARHGKMGYVTKWAFTLYIYEYNSCVMHGLKNCLVSPPGGA